MSFSNLTGASVVVLLGFILLAPLTLTYFVRRFVITPWAIKEFSDLHSRRVQRVRQALASSTNSGWTDQSSTAAYPFSGWVDLMPNGMLKIAGEAFSPHQVFQVAARDESNIPRARVSCKGTGEIFIFSHGQAFRAEFRDQQWAILLVPIVPA